jgi:hypothetical protein
LPDSVAVQTERPWTVAFYAGLPVEGIPQSPTAPAVVTARDTVPGYRRAFRSGSDAADGFAAVPGRFSVWIKNEEKTP